MYFRDKGSNLAVPLNMACWFEHWISQSLSLKPFLFSSFASYMLTIKIYL